jgi:hypothetical protein
MPRLDEILVARSDRASKDARLAPGYADVAIQSPRAPHVPLDCFPPDLIRGSLAMMDALPFQKVTL